MSGLFRRKPIADDAPAPGGDDATVELRAAEAPAAPPPPPPAEPDETATAVHDAPPKKRRWRREKAPVAAPAEHGLGLDIPAGTDLDKLVGPVPTTQRRGRLRRRLRHLRSVREVLLRDLGGMVFEVHRAERTTDQAVQRIVDEKLTRLEAVNAELKDLEALLEDRQGLTVREPGISGTCPNCGELFGSDARFCWACGTPVAPGARRPPEALSVHHVESTAAELPPPPLTPPPPPPPPPVP